LSVCVFVWVNECEFLVDWRWPLSCVCSVMWWYMYCRPITFHSIYPLHSSYAAPSTPSQAKLARDSYMHSRILPHSAFLCILLFTETEIKTYCTNIPNLYTHSFIDNWGMKRPMGWLVVFKNDVIRKAPFVYQQKVVGAGGVQSVYVRWRVPDFQYSV
jgi:hypothetical protein